MLGRKFITNQLLNRVGSKAYNATMTSAKAAGQGVGKATSMAVASSDRAMAMGAKRAKMQARGILATGAVMGSTAMRPNSNQSRTSYRGPMQTGRGIGRFS